jgi:hypothetical protein
VSSCLMPENKYQLTDGDAELVARDNGATDLSRGNLGHVENDDGRDETDAEARDQTTGNDEAETGRRGDLKNTADGENDAAADDGDTTTKVVGEVTGDDGTEEGTGGEDGGDQGLLPSGEGKGGGLGGSGVGSGYGKACVKANEAERGVSGCIAPCSKPKGQARQSRAGSDVRGGFARRFTSSCQAHRSCNPSHNQRRYPQRRRTHTAGRP